MNTGTALLQAFKERDLPGLKRLLVADEIQSEDFAPLLNYLTESKEDLKKRLKAVIVNPDGEEGQKFKGLMFLQHNFDVKCLNALPQDFATIRDQIVFVIAEAGRDIPDSYVSLSTGLLKYASRINLSNDKLKSQINLLLKKQEDKKRWENVLVNEEARKKTTRNYIITGILFVAAVFGAVRGFNKYQEWKANQEVTESGSEQSTQTSTSSATTSRKAQDTNEEWFRNERLLAASFVFGDEAIQELKKKSDVKAELKSLDFRFGNDPIQCYQSTVFDCKRPAKSITVHGDKTHDAILFMMWNGRVGRQVYIKKNTSFYVWVNKNEEVDMAVIFGKDWDDNLDNPCGGKGFFSKDVIFAPPTSNATIPKHLSTGEDRIKLRLRHEKLLAKQNVNQERFMYIMTDYD